jgi:hypothetical protein
MLTGKRLLLVVAILATAAALLTVAPWWSKVSAQVPGAQTEGAWYGIVSFSPAPGVSGTFPFLAHFNQDGTWMSDDARALGFIPPFTQATTLTGSWVRKGARKVAWRGVEIAKSAAPIEIAPGVFTSWFLLVGEGSHEFAPGDPDHAINGAGTTSLYACPPDAANATGFSCPTLDAILSGAVPALPGFPPFTFTLTRIRP